MFDVSHMTVTDVGGNDATDFLRYLLANDVARLTQAGMALYTGMLNQSGGVIDDLIVYRMHQGYRLVTNCATRHKVLSWIKVVGNDYDISIRVRTNLSIIAVHGPDSIPTVCAALPESFATAIYALQNFRSVELGDWLIARTGYTGEKGVELILPHADAELIWQSLAAAGVSPVGLAARDTLRLEAGMNLYGKDMDESVSPLSANMARTIAWESEDRNFVGRMALIQLMAEGVGEELVGIAYHGRGVMRDGYRVITDAGEGVISSGGFSPTLSHSIALARVPVGSSRCQVLMRGALQPAELVKPNFVRFGKRIY